MGVPVDDFRLELEELVKKHLYIKSAPVNLLTDMKVVMRDLEGLAKFAQAYYEGLPNQKPESHRNSPP
jgi:hypothetical protein